MTIVNWARKRVSRVRAAIWRTSQPDQTGFSADCDVGPGAGKVSTGTGSCGCGSLFGASGSNCGFAGEDRKILSSVQVSSDKFLRG